MPHPVATTAAIAAPTLETRQARLDAAIAFFRSEASASGYVVEEVRLRLPVPDVEVTPRVVIAQQTASSCAPPAYPRAKQHRPLSSYPQNGQLPPDYHPSQVQDASYTNSTLRPFGNPGKMAQNASNQPKTVANGAGFKRTVSGSTIFHSTPTRSNPALRENSIPSQDRASTRTQGVSPMSSIPYLPPKDSHSALPPQGQHFWRTVIGGDKGKQILQAAESMQRLRHSGLEQNRHPMDFNASPVEVTETAKDTVMEDKPKLADNQQSPNDENKEKRNGDEKKENTHHINGHDIPESDVQLLLSSAADISARERKGSPKLAEKPQNSVIPEKEKRNNRPPAAVFGGKLSGGKVGPTSGRQYSSRSRRDGSERRSSSSAARPYKCTALNCTSSFDREGHLRVHILAVHEKKRPFVCQVCDASFGHSSSLLRHVRTVHQASPAVGSGRIGNSSKHKTPRSNDSGTTKSELICGGAQDDSEKHFRCSACRMAFNRVALLNRHVAEKHPLQTPRSDNESKTKRSP